MNVTDESPPLPPSSLKLSGEVDVVCTNWLFVDVTTTLSLAAAPPRNSILLDTPLAWNVCDGAVMEMPPPPPASALIVMLPDALSVWFPADVSVTLP